MKTTSKSAKHLRREIQIPVGDLRVGMFVARPDCGWHKTPFMLQGFLIQDVREISTLAQFAEQVVVDLRRSQLQSFSDKYLGQVYEDISRSRNPQKFRKIRSGQPMDRNDRLPLSRERKAVDIRSLLGETDADSVSTATGNRSGRSDKSFTGMIAIDNDAPFREYIFSVHAPQAANGNEAGFFQTFSQWIRGLIGYPDPQTGKTRKPRPVSQKDKPSFVPADLRLVIYPAPEPTFLSIPKARTACDHLEASLKRIVDDISIRGLSNVDTLREAADTVVDNMIARPDTMMWVAKMRAYSDARYQQALSVAIHLTALGRQIGFQREQLADLAAIGLLLDVGKVTIDVSLLNKPGRLTKSEIDIIRTHVRQGLKMFGESGTLPETVIRAIAEHHERIDGAGYPNGLSGKDISVYGKMAAIIDSFVAMVNPRPYAPTYSAYDAIRQLFRESDSRWFKPLVEQFVQSIGIFPVSSLVELSTGEIAIIVQHNRVRRMEPKVLVVTSRTKSILERPWDLDMLRHNRNAKNQEVHIRKGVADGAYGIDFRKYYLNAT